MRTKIITAFAAILLASVSTAALAQDQDHDHDRGGDHPHAAGGAPHPQAAPASPAAPAGGDHPHAMGAPGGQWRGRGAPMPQPASPTPAAPVQPRAQPAPAAQAAQPQGQRFDGGPRRDRGGAQPMPGGPPPAAQVPPAQGPGARQGYQGDRQGYQADRQGYQGDRGGDRRDYGDRGRDDHRDWDPRRGAPPPRWQRDRYPPVYASPQRYHSGYYRAPYGFFVRSWSFGDILPRGWYGDNYVIGDFWDYGLPYPPPGFEWVRVGADALLIDGYTGRVVQVVRYLFW